jgi:LuxR family maltose regulon positive regulatory protein
MTVTWPASSSRTVDEGIPDGSARQLLATKYSRPPLASHSIERASLFVTLAEPRGVVLVSAPPGYGKTTLVAGWLAAEDRTSAWLTLDETDNDPAVFIAYLTAALQRVVPSLDPAVGLALASSPTTASIIPLLNALDESGEPCVLVLDDYHLVSSERVHEIAAFLTGHLPANLRVVVVTRHDPPLPLARLRARGQLTEIRASDLRFSATDAYRFLAESMALQIPQRTVEQLTERTEGWIAGLQLAALSLRGREDPEAFVAAFGSTDRYIFDYLTDEALERQPPDVRTFLESTCVLDRLSGPLCDALTGRTDGATTLAALAQANLFLMPLDERRAWYRYHPLFADLLVSSLPAARQVELHRAAGAWFARHDLPLDGIAHYLAANEADEAAALIEVVADATIARGEFATVTGWCDALPRAALAARPGLGVMGAWAQFFLGDISGAEASLAALGDERNGDVSSNPRRACLEAWFANRRDRLDAEALARRAIAGIPESDPVFRSLAFTTLGESLVARDVRRAVKAFEEAHRLAQVAGRSMLLAGSVYSLANANLILGRRRETEALCRRTIAEATDRAAVSPAWLGMIHLPLGVALHEADELVQARQQIATGQELCERAGLRVTMLGAAEWHEALGLHLLGEGSRAWQRLEATRRDGERHGIGRVVTAMTLLAAELLLLEGDPPGARARLEELPTSHLEVLGATRDRARLTRARVLLATSRPDAALEIIDPLAVEQRIDGRFGRLIDTLAVIAHARDRAGDRAGWEAALTEAVGLAAGEDRRRAFLDSVFPVGHLLPHVRRVAPAFVDDVLARLGKRASSSLPALSSARAAAVRNEGEGPVEPLSVRELEVLRLVAAGLSNEEIGRELYVSSGTAKWHVHNVLAKLGSRNRVALVARARSLGLL